MSLLHAKKTGLRLKLQDPSVGCKRPLCFTVIRSLKFVREDIKTSNDKKSYALYKFTQGPRFMGVRVNVGSCYVNAT